MLAGVVVLLAAQTASALPIPSYVPTVLSPASQASSFVGAGIRIAGDINHDGVNDIIVPYPRASAGGMPAVGHVFVFSGRTRALLLSLDDPQPQAKARFGASAFGIGDVNGDGVPDLAVGAPGQDVGGNAAQGRVYVFSGKDGHPLYTVDDPVPQAKASFGFGTGTGDLNGDRVPDFVENAGGQAPCAPTPNSFRCVGAAYAFSGRDGRLLYAMPNPSGQPGFYGEGTSDPGDVTGDGVDDVLIGDSGALVDGNRNQGRAYLFDGRTGRLVRIFDDPHPQAGAFFGDGSGERDAPGDLDRDGVPDILIAADGQDAPTVPSAGQAYVFSGKSGALVRTISSPLPQTGGFFGFRFSQAGDLNGDGTPDLLIGQAGTPDHKAQGGAWVFDGRTGGVLASFARPQDQGAGQSVAFAGDVNGDGRPDYFLGAPYLTIAGNVNVGGLVTEISSAPRTASGLIDQAMPRRARRARFRLRVSGRLLPAPGLLSPCSGGNVTVRVASGRRTLAFRRISVSSDCSYRVALAVRRPRGARRLAVFVDFAGNRVLLPVRGRTLAVFLSRRRR